MFYKIYRLFFCLIMICIPSLYSLDFLDQEESDQYIHSLASLVFYIEECKACLEKQEQISQSVTFSDDDLALLWAKVYDAFNKLSLNHEMIGRESLDLAYEKYEQMKKHVLCEHYLDALEAANITSYFLHLLWSEAIQLEDSGEMISLLLRKKKDPNLDGNPYIPNEAQRKMRPYLLPLKHPMRSVLDNLCLKRRITADKRAFSNAGFRTIDKRPRSYIRVARHARLPGYLVKVYLDTVLNEKEDKPSWKWLVYRCRGVQKIIKIIQKRNIKHFVAANKWIYCLPAEPSPPDDALHTRHLALLLVTDMDLVSDKENLKAWYSYITKEHLDELYCIISRAKGSSYRPDNIAFTEEGKFAFIDTEYPFRGPDFKGIRSYLNSEMLHYWDSIVRHGGK